jgi:hypothetical protein
MRMMQQMHHDPMNTSIFDAEPYVNRGRRLAATKDANAQAKGHKPRS